jgi:hypothetical protein
VIFQENSDNGCSSLVQNNFRATTSASRSAAKGQHRFPVFRAESGKRAVVVVNPGFDAATMAQVMLPNPEGSSKPRRRIRQARPLREHCKLPRSAAVLSEL